MAAETPRRAQIEQPKNPTPAELFKAVIRIQQKAAAILEELEIQALIDKHRGPRG